MQVFGPNELVEDVLKRDFCIGCGACVNLCPYFKSHHGKIAMLFPCTLSQGQCFAFCPKVELDLDALSSELLGHPYDGSDLGSVQEVLASRAGEKMEPVDAQLYALRKMKVTTAMSRLRRPRKGDPTWDELLETAEKKAIVKAITAAEGNKNKAAEMLQVSKNTIYRRIAQYDATDPGWMKILAAVRLR